MFRCSFLTTYLYINDINERHQPHAAVTYHDCAYLLFDDAVTLMAVLWTKCHIFSDPYPLFTLRATCFITSPTTSSSLILFLFTHIPYCFSCALFKYSSMIFLYCLFVRIPDCFSVCSSNTYCPLFLNARANSEVRVSWALDFFLWRSLYITRLCVY